MHSEAFHRDAAYTQLVAAETNIVVAENCMKWAGVHPAADHYTFTAADAMVRFAEDNSMQMRGHNLVWHENLPAWVGTQLSTANGRQVLEKHIRTVAGRYTGRLHSWDVVNEAIEINDGRPDGLRKSVWLRSLGEAYLSIAFEAARAADPHALLTYNDYGFEYDTESESIKRQMVLDLLRRLKHSGTPLDAVGIQAHLRSGTGERIGPGLREFIREAHQLGLQVFVTELDVDDSHLPGDFHRRDAAVAEVYGQFLDLLLEEGVTVVVTWGITDRYTWLNKLKPRFDGQPQRALPFDESLRPKPAWTAMRGALGPVVKVGTDTGPEPAGNLSGRPAARSGSPDALRRVNPVPAASQGSSVSPSASAPPASGEWANDPYAPFAVPQKPPK